jgi:hypothetical protein
MLQLFPSKPIGQRERRGREEGGERGGEEEKKEKKEEGGEEEGGGKREETYKCRHCNYFLRSLWGMVCTSNCQVG